MKAFSLPLLALAVVAAAQDGATLSKAEERAKFHPTSVRGMSAAERLKGYEARQRMKAESPFAGIKWRNIGPEIQGGRILDIEAPASDPDTLYVAFATGGLYRTKDDGITWEPLWQDYSSFGIGDVAISRDGKTLFLGSGEPNSQRTSYAGTGVYKSTDSGKTWTNVGLPESHHIGRVVMDPRNENVVYVAVMGHLYSQNSERGLYKTSDGGKTWNQILKVDDYTGAVEIKIDPSNSNRLICSMWDRDRRAWNFRESGKGSAVYISNDAGKTWSKAKGLPEGDAAGRTGIAFAPSNPKRVYAFVDNQSIDPEWAYADERQPSGRLTARRFLLLDTEKLKAIDERILGEFLRTVPRANLTASAVIADVKAGKLDYDGLKKKLLEANPDLFSGDILQSELYRSDDGGNSWTKMPPIGGIGGYYWGKVFVNPKNADEVWVTGVPLLRSRDGGKTWIEVAERAHVDHHAIWHDPRNPEKVWIGNDGGLYLSYNGGVDIRHINNLSVAQATTLAVDNKRPYNVIIGNQDNGTMRGPSTYVPGRSDKSLWVDLFGGDGSAIAVDPREELDLTYVAFQFGQHFALEPGKQARRVTPGPDVRGETLRFNWISPFIISPHHPDIVYVGSQKVHRSFNRGVKWESISGDLTKNRPNGDVPHSTIKDLSESPFKFGLIIAGTDDGNVRLTTDAGATWRNIDTPVNKWVSRVIASRHDANTLYVSQNGYREDDFAPYVWKSTDLGKTWVSIAGNLPNEVVEVVREDPKSKDILYVGTDMGAYVTFDGGKSWVTLHGGMPNQPVHDIVIQEREDDLVAATHSQGAWILQLDQIRRYANPEFKRDQMQILTFDDVRRRNTWGLDRREPWNTAPPSEPQASGLIYTLAAGTAKVRFKDKDGKVALEREVPVVKGFNDVSVSLQTAPGKPIVPNPNRKAGSVEEAIADPFADARPKYLATGEYTLEIEVDGKIVTKAWKLTD